jgi:hypothetical protein
MTGRKRALSTIDDEAAKAKKKKKTAEKTSEQEKEKGKKGKKGTGKEQKPKKGKKMCVSAVSLLLSLTPSFLGAKPLLCELRRTLPHNSQLTLPGEFPPFFFVTKIHN